MHFGCELGFTRILGANKWGDPMNNVTLFTFAGICYSVGGIISFLKTIGFLQRNRIHTKHILVAGIIIHTAAYGVRWLETAGRGFEQTPLSLFTLYESLVFSAWGLVAIFLIRLLWYRKTVLGQDFGTALCAALLMGYASFSGSVNPSIQELPSVLRGNLFVPHALTSTAAFSSFLLASIDSTIILLRWGRIWRPMLRGKENLELNDVAQLDDCAYTVITTGFMLYTVGMVTGAYRCKVIWGSYWSWDPSEISSLIVWIVYALILHGRYQRWWRPQTTAVLTLFAFVLACLCFVISAQIVMESRHYPIQ